MKKRNLIKIIVVVLSLVMTMSMFVACAPEHKCDDPHCTHNHNIACADELATVAMVDCPDCDGTGKCTETIEEDCDNCVNGQVEVDEVVDCTSCVDGEISSITTCPDCDGDGYTTTANGSRRNGCATCGGSGYEDPLNSTENDYVMGSGTITVTTDCTVCGGDGTVLETTTVDCDEEGCVDGVIVTQVEVDCETCNGTGEIEEGTSVYDCEHCHDRGALRFTDGATCPDCTGLGYITTANGLRRYGCTTCGGSGYEDPLNSTENDYVIGSGIVNYVDCPFCDVEADEDFDVDDLELYAEFSVNYYYSKNGNWSKLFEIESYCVDELPTAYAEKYKTVTYDKAGLNDVDFDELLEDDITVYVQPYEYFTVTYYREYKALIGSKWEFWKVDDEVKEDTILNEHLNDVDADFAYWSLDKDGKKMIDDYVVEKDTNVYYTQIAGEKLPDIADKPDIGDGSEISDKSMTSTWLTVGLILLGGVVVFLLVRKK